MQGQHPLEDLIVLPLVGVNTQRTLCMNGSSLHVGRCLLHPFSRTAKDSLSQSLLLGMCPGLVPIPLEAEVHVGESCAHDLASLTQQDWEVCRALVNTLEEPGCQQMIKQWETLRVMLSADACI